MFINLAKISSCMSLIFYCALGLANDKAGAVWDYTGDRGTSHWASLDPAYEFCGIGKEQSPINIQKAIPQPGHLLEFHYQPVPLDFSADGITTLNLRGKKIIIDNDHTLQLDFKQNHLEYVTANRERYFLKQFHFHSPSENQLNGQAFPLEIHFVHQGSTGNLAVVGVFIKEGKANAELAKILTNLPALKEQKHTLQNPNLDLYGLLPSKHSFYSFKGSLTTPPCSENVEWLIMAEPIQASFEQIAKLKQFLGHENAREVQPLNKRKVFYTPR